MSARTGMSAEFLSELGYALGQSGSSAEDLDKAVKGMQVNLLNLGRGMKGTVEDFTALGLSSQDFAGLNAEEQFMLISERLAAIQDPGKRAALALGLFGRAGRNLMPWLNAGPEGMVALREEARALGLIVSQEQATAAAAMGDAWDRVSKATMALVFKIGGALAPALTDIANKVAFCLKPIGDWITQNKNLIVSIGKIALIVMAAGAGLVVIGTLISSVGTVLGMFTSVWVGIGTVLGTIGSALLFLISPLGLVLAAVVGLGAVFATQTTVLSDSIEWLKIKFAKLSAFTMTIFGGIKNAMAGGDFSLAAEILWLSLKLAWQKGVNELTDIWIGFKTVFFNVVTETMAGVSRLVADAWAGLQIIWVETIAAFQTAWVGLTSFLRSTWNSTQGWLAKKIVGLMGYFDKSIDVNAAVRQIDEDTARGNQGVAANQQARVAAIRTESQATADRIGDELVGTREEIDAQAARDKEDRVSRFGEQRRQGEVDLFAARERLGEALARAAIATPSDQTNAVKKQAETSKTAGMAGGGLASASFNALAAVRGVGVRSWTKALEDKTDETNGLLGDIKNKIAPPGLQVME